MTKVRAPDCRLATIGRVRPDVVELHALGRGAGRAACERGGEGDRGERRGEASGRLHVTLSGGVSVLSIEVYQGISRKNAKYRIVPTCAMRVSVLVGVCMPR